MEISEQRARQEFKLAVAFALEAWDYDRHEIWHRLGSAHAVWPSYFLAMWNDGGRMEDAVADAAEHERAAAGWE